ncbi:MAG: hypothetical protein GXP21_00355 [Gammaproteobacteria bacterium]|nr:hypothetical protein [Gammaproteobacteria bacterium]
MTFNRVTKALLVTWSLHPLIALSVLYGTALIFRLQFDVWPVYGDSRFILMQLLLDRLVISTIGFGVVFVIIPVVSLFLIKSVDIKKIIGIYFLSLRSLVAKRLMR